MKTIIKVLASDFKNNSYLNIESGLEGCPLERAFTRAGLTTKYKSYMDYMNGGTKEELMVQHMFKGIIPIEDFSFEIDV